MPRRRASEGMIKVNMEVLFDERVKDIQKSVLEKTKLLAANPGYDQPILRERLYTSMIWGDYEFLGNPQFESEESKMIIIENSLEKSKSDDILTPPLNRSTTKSPVNRGKITKGLLKELKFDDDFMLNLDSDCLTDGGTHILKLQGQISESVR